MFFFIDLSGGLLLIIDKKLPGCILQAAIEEGVVVGGGCCLLRLSTKVDGIKELLDNEEQKACFLSNSFL